jgi:uncharacterized membrane protein YcfT
MKTISIPLPRIPRFLLKTIISVLMLIIVLIVCLIGFHQFIKYEKTNVKSEVTETVKAINSDSLALYAAKTIHKFSTFTEKIKSELKKLDSSSNK